MTVSLSPNPVNDPAWGAAEAVDFVGVSPPRSLTQVVLGFMYTWTTSIRTSKDWWRLFWGALWYGGVLQRLLFESW